MINTEQLSQIFSGTSGIIATYFFGSQVSGKTDAFSDYDFAVLLPAGWSKGKRWTLVGELIDKAFAVVRQDNADVVDISNQPHLDRESIGPPKLAHRITRNHRNRR